MLKVLLVLIVAVLVTTITSLYDLPIKLFTALYQTHTPTSEGSLTCDVSACRDINGKDLPCMSNSNSQSYALSGIRKQNTDICMSGQV